MEDLDKMKFRTSSKKTERSKIFKIVSWRKIKK